ncbi:DNA phosphorothioation-dependent restriction protein DptG [Clostridium sp. A1-XYC3]|uniref:DNA phosphorothioation-dependent restriction protein DptG n=1 Tax=Clostridium tanneri TaxID=3037988 RepID=A0ABU4JX01_9CLOT|nr:DNA phosphorothioation-dependent restriction protein DptG [Clostridium sp. A1-XYC3]MDW8802463.1 DNA phosphorothioation-dependent restriction protein DptG [Clostridium sp. A1-XYC3]
MSGIKSYNLDFEKIETTFKFKDSGLTHSQGNQFKLLPYAANEKTLVSNFNGVVGAFSRIICNKELKSEFNFTEFIEDVTDEIGEFEGSNSKEVFKDMIRTMFIDKENLVDFDIKTINYITSTNSDEKIARFLYSIFFDEELKSLVVKHYDRNVENILYKLVLNALPELKEKNYIIDSYKCYLPFIKELFTKDFKFLIENEELYKTSLKRVLEYYYMFYVSQLAIKLSKFEKADLTKPEVIYYTLGWESTSKNRTAYKFGWELLKNNVESLFSHAITLEFLNHHGLGEQFGYLELFDLFNSMDENEVESQIELLYQEYTKRITDKDWNDFKEKGRDSGNKAFNKVYELFEAIEYQFNKSSRSRANEAYRNWYIKFVHENFSKKRGSLGYNLNLNEEDIILMTKLCINNNDKLKLNLLFDEFEKRGMFFDRDSKIKIVQLYEKLNLLEKKSDSGDAQYVKSVL